MLPLLDFFMRINSSVDGIEDTLICLSVCTEAFFILSLRLYKENPDVCTSTGRTFIILVVVSVDSVTEPSVSLIAVFSKICEGFFLLLPLPFLPRRAWSISFESRFCMSLPRLGTIGETEVASTTLSQKILLSILCTCTETLGP